MRRGTPLNARFARLLPTFLMLLGLTAAVAQAQEPPYFVTYSHVMEEPGNLEIASQNIGATPKNANPFYGQTVELEYGVAAWYTAEVYLQGQSTVHDSTVFTGFRFENRFRPLRSEHWVNPVLYVEYEDVSSADKSFLEITGNHVVSDQAIANAVLRKDVEHSVEGKLILSSNFNGFNISENIIAEKNVSNEPWEFGYAVGGAHSLSTHASVTDCRFCRQYFAVGGELFGGLGTRYDFGFKSTSIYAGPTIAYNSPHSYTITAGPEFGLNANSSAVLWRLKASYEFSQIRDHFRRER